MLTFFPFALYLLAALGLLCGLFALLFKVAERARACPQVSPAFSVATLAIAGAYGSIGLGAIALIGALGLSGGGVTLQQVLAMFGLAGVVLGVGFSIAAVTLRDAARPPAPTPAPMTEG